MEDGFYSVSGLVIDMIWSILFHPVSIRLFYSLSLCWFLRIIIGILKGKEGQHTGITRSIHQYRAVYHTSTSIKSEWNK